MPALAVSAPASFAQTIEPNNELEAAVEQLDRPNAANPTEESQPSASPESTKEPARAVDFLTRISEQKQAEEQWRKALEQNPKNAQAYRNLADALTGLNRYRDAEAIYQRAIQLDPTDEASYIAFGKFLQDQTRLYDAATLYEEMVETLPESAIAYEQLANSLTLVSTEDWPTQTIDIEDAYRQSIRLNPTRPDPYYGLGKHLARQNRFPEAMSTLREIVRFEPNNETIYKTLAAIPTLSQEPAAVAAVYQEGLVAQPQNSELYLSYASWLSNRNQKAQAEAVYQRALEQLPTDPKINQAYAEYLTAEGRVAEAKSRYQTAIEQNYADGATTYIQYGDLLVQQGQIDAAKAAYQQAILLSPDLSTYEKLGTLLQETEGTDAAVALYQQAINKPRVEAKSDFYHRIGQLLQAAGNTEEAIANYRKALDITDSPSSAQPLATLLLEQGQYDEALSLYERFRSTFGTNPEALQDWQTALRELDRPEDAEALPQTIQTRLAKDRESLYRRAIAISPESGYFYDLLGDVLMQQSRPEDAEVAYQEAIRLNYGVFKTRIKLGQALFEQGKMTEAEKIYQQALDRAPESDRQYFMQDESQLYQQIGNLYESTNRLALALKFYQEALSISPYEFSIRQKVDDLAARIAGSTGTSRASTEDSDTNSPRESD